MSLFRAAYGGVALKIAAEGHKQELAQTNAAVQCSKAKTAIHNAALSTEDGVHLVHGAVGAPALPAVAVALNQELALEHAQILAQQMGDHTAQAQALRLIQTRLVMYR